MLSHSVPRTPPGTAGAPREQARLNVIPLKAVVGTVEHQRRPEEDTMHRHLTVPLADQSAAGLRTAR
jgi:hypothetical protein